jgi:hypothetical protein
MRRSHLAVSRSYNRTVNADTAKPDFGSANFAPGSAAGSDRVPKRAAGPWVRSTGRAADVDVRILSDRTEDGGSVTRLVDGRGRRLHPDLIVGRPGREDEVAIAIANTITELLRRA